MNEMVSTLLDCSMEIEALQSAPRNIVKTVKHAISMTNVRPEFRRIAITHRHEGLATGWFDASRVERAVLNLLLNACEAVSPHTGQIIITTTGTRAHLQLDVWDNGPGIPTAIQQSIFQPYVSYGKANGHGLGLAIAKKIVEDHGGEIYFDASCKTGTLFKITIPFAVPHGTVARAPVRPGLHFALHCGLSPANPTAVLLVAGVMDLRAMADVTATVTAERVAPTGGGTPSTGPNSRLPDK